MKRTRKLTLALLLMVLVALVISGCYGPGMTPAGFSGVTLSADASQAYLALNTFVYSVNMADGVEAWRFPAKADAKKTFFSPPALTSDGQLIIGSGNHYLYSINSGTGAQNWQYPADKSTSGRFIATPLVVNDTIYAPNENGILYALDLKGAEKWNLQLGGELWATPTIDPDTNNLYVTSLNHYIYAVSPDGKQVWKIDMGASIAGTPAAANSQVYIGNFNSEMASLDPANGNRNWTYKTANWAWAGPALNEAKDTLYFGDTAGFLYGLKAADGSEIWKVQTDGAITSTPAVTADHIYVTTDAGTLFAVKLDGSIDWKQTYGGKLYASPVVAGDTILLAPSQDKTKMLFAVNVSGGSEKWPQAYNGQAPK